MLALTVAIISSSMIALLFKQSEAKKLNKYAVTLGNYITATLLAFSMYYLGNSLTTIDSSTIILGSVTGIFFLLSFVFYQLAVKNYGASMAGMYGKLGILVPMLLSLGLFKEAVSVWQWTGIAIAMLAILMTAKNDSEKLSVNTGLLALFFIGGLAEFGNKLFQFYGVMAQKPLFLVIVFLVAGLLCYIYILMKKIKLDLGSIVFGCLVGIANLMSSYFLISALDTMPGSVVFPVFSAGSMALIAVLSHLIFKEKLSSKQKIAIVIALCALVLVNR